MPQELVISPHDSRQIQAMAVFVCSWSLEVWDFGLADLGGQGLNPKPYINPVYTKVLSIFFSMNYYCSFVVWVYGLRA